MGNCCSGKKKAPKDIKENKDVPKNTTIKISEKRQVDDTLFYKPKSSSNKLICYRPSDRAFWEEKIDKDCNFQAGMIFGKIKPGCYICIGGQEEGETGFILDTVDKKATKITPPPMSLSYGRALVYRSNVYVIGSLCIEADGNEKPAPPLYYDLTNKK